MPPISTILLQMRFCLPIGCILLTMFVALSCSTAAVDQKDNSTSDDSATPGDSLSTLKEMAKHGVAVYAGTGKGSGSGDGGPGINAEISAPAGLAVDSHGNLFIVTESRVRKIDVKTGVISTVAGTGSPSFGGDGGPAIEAKLKNPLGISIDSHDNLFIADAENGRVRKIDSISGIITTVAGGGIPKREGGVLLPGDGGLATDAWFKTVTGVTVDSKGNIYFSAVNRIRKVDAQTGIITTLAGHGTMDMSGDGGPSTASGVASPGGIAVDAKGNVYFADSLNQRIRMIDGSTGIITTLAGIGKHPQFTLPKGYSYSVGNVPAAEGKGFSGDGGPATEAMLAGPLDVALGPDGNLYVADTDNDRIRMINLQTGVITTVIDGGAVIGEAMTSSGGGGEREISFENFSPPVAIALNSEGIIYLSDQAQNKIIKFGP